MFQLEINGVQTTINPGFLTWQELLADLESTRLRQNEVIASVQFDGDEVLHFRQENVLTRPLQSIQQIRVSAIEMRDLARDAINDASSYLQSLEMSMVNVAESLRNGMVHQANDKLHQVLEGVKLFVALLRGVELSVDGMASSTKSAVEEIFEQMKPALESLIQAQTQQDWALLADVLEYELLANLTGFEETLATFNAKVGAE